MKIALFTDTYYPQVNGVARTLKRYTDYLAKRNIECELFIPEMDGENMYPRVHQFTSVPFMLYPECRTAFALPTTIIEKVQAFSPDIIHVTTPLTMGLLGSYTAKKLQIPLVSSYHTHFDTHFVEELVTLISNDRLLTSLSIEARKYAMEQSWDSIFDRLLSEYRETLELHSYKNLKEA